MARRVLCDDFRQEQLVPARQIRTVLSVYVASREERSAANGLGCSVKDLLSDDEKRMKVADLMRMKVSYPNGKKVKAYNLKGGRTYTVVGVPTQQNYGVFIVPRGTKYEYIYNDRPLPPGSCLLFDGQKSKVIDYKLFRKLFIMAPNPVSAGQKRSGYNRYQNQPAPPQREPAPNAYNQFKTRPAPQNKQQSSQNQPYTQHRQSPTNQAPTNQAQPKAMQLHAVGRLVRNNDIVGLVLSDGVQQLQIPYQQCLTYAEKGMITNVKAVNRAGTRFLSGNGISLEMLPYTQL